MTDWFIFILLFSCYEKATVALSFGRIRTAQELTILQVFRQCWDYCHFHESESECESLSYESESESESTKTQNHESECESESECHESECESESAKTEDHESEFEKFENLTGMWNLKFGQSYFSMDKRFRRFCKKTFAQRFCKRCTIF